MDHCQHYLIALGSNKPHPRFGNPADIIPAALDHLASHGITIDSVAATITSRPVGPSTRVFANSAAIITTILAPPDLLRLIKATEQAFGRKASARWAARVLDIDIILWSGGIWADPMLDIPHLAFRDRDFVLKPAEEIARFWRDPVTLRHIGQLLHRRRLTSRAHTPRRRPS